MKHRLIPAVVLAACTLAPLASFAAPAAENYTNVGQAKCPLVKVTLKNRSNTTQTLTIEGKTVTVAANQEYKLAAPAGTQVYGSDNTVKLTIVKEYDGAVCSFR